MLMPGSAWRRRNRAGCLAACADHLSQSDNFVVGQRGPSTGFCHSTLNLHHSTDDDRSAMPNWLASPASETDVSCGYEPTCQSDQLVFRRRFTDHSPGHSAALWRKEIARARTRNGSGDQRIPEGEGRI